MLFNVAEPMRVIIPKEDFEACSPYWIPRAKRSLVILSWPHRSLAFSQPPTHLSHLIKRQVLSGQRPTETCQESTGRFSRGMGRTTIASPDNVFPEPSRLTPPGTKRRPRSARNVIPSGGREGGTQTDSGSRGRGQHPSTDIVNPDTEDRELSGGREETSWRPERAHFLKTQARQPCLQKWQAAPHKRFKSLMGGTEASTKTSAKSWRQTQGRPPTQKETFGPHPSNHPQSYQKCVYLTLFNYEYLPSGKLT